MAYLRDQLSDYHRYMAGEFPTTPEEDEMHNASRPIIDSYQQGRRLKGARMPDGAKGKKRMFSNYYFLNTPSPLQRAGTVGSSSESESCSSAGSSQSSAGSRQQLSTEKDMLKSPSVRPISFDAPFTTPGIYLCLLNRFKLLTCFTCIIKVSTMGIPVSWMQV